MVYIDRLLTTTHRVLTPTTTVSISMSNDAQSMRDLSVRVVTESLVLCERNVLQSRVKLDIRHHSPHIHHMNNGTPSAQRVAIHSISKRLRDGLKQVLRFLKCTSVNEQHYANTFFSMLTRSGSQSASHMPYRFADDVPHTTKSLAKLMHPIKSMLQMKGVALEPSLLTSRPAMHGSA